MKKKTFCFSVWFFVQLSASFIRSDKGGHLVIEYRGWGRTKTLMSLRQGVDCGSYTTASHLSPSLRTQAGWRTFRKVTAYRPFRRSMFFPSAFGDSYHRGSGSWYGLISSQLQRALATLGPATLQLLFTPYRGCYFVLSSLTLFLSPLAFRRSFPLFSASPGALYVFSRPLRGQGNCGPPLSLPVKELELCQWLHLWSSELFG